MDINKVTKEEMKDVLEASKSLRQVIMKFGLSANGSGGYVNIKNKIKGLGLEVPEYTHYGLSGSWRRFRNEEVFVENSTYGRHSIKKRIIDEKLIKYVCDECNLVDEWNGKKIVLQLDHINGINDDNRLENLRFLCPNCHSQTETFSNKRKKKTKPKTNKVYENFCIDCGIRIKKRSKRCSKCYILKSRRVERPSHKELVSDIKELGYSATGRKYDVSDNSIRKWIKYYENR